MALRHAIGDTLEIGHGVWLAELSPDDVRRIGEGQFSVGGRSVVGVSGAVYIRETRMLSIDPGSAIVLNIGESKEVCFVELLDENKLITKSEIVDGADKKPLGDVDKRDSRIG